MKLLNNFTKKERTFIPFKIELEVESLREAAILQILFNASGLGFETTMMYRYIQENCEAQGLDFKCEQVWQEHRNLIHQTIRK